MPYQPGSYNPLSLADVAAAAQAETQVRQAGAQNIQQAQVANDLAMQQAQIAAAQAERTRNYSFTDEQRRLDESLKRGLLEASLAAKARESAASSSREAADRAWQLQMRQMDNDEWYKRAMFERDLAAQDQKAQEDAARPRTSDFGRNTTRGLRGEAISRYYQDLQAAKKNPGKTGTKDALTAYLQNTTGSERRARALLDDNGGGFSSEKQKLRDKLYGQGALQDPYTMWNVAEKHFREILRKRKGNVEDADELASIALYDLGFITEVG